MRHFGSSVKPTFCVVGASPPPVVKSRIQLICRLFFRLPQSPRSNLVLALKSQPEVWTKPSLAQPAVTVMIAPVAGSRITNRLDGRNAPVPERLITVCDEKNFC